MIKDHRIKEYLITGIKISFGKINPKLQLDINTSNYNEEIRYNVRYDEEICYDLIYEIENWIEKVKPSIIIRFWRLSHNFAYFITILLVLFFIAIISNTKRDQYEIEVKNELTKLIENSISDSTLSRAVELLLILNSDYVPNDFEKKPIKINSKKRNIVIIIFIIGLIWTIPPKTCFELGKGKIYYKTWSLWIKFVLVLIPSMIIFPKIIELIKIQHIASQSLKNHSCPMGQQRFLALPIKAGKDTLL